MADTDKVLDVAIVGAGIAGAYAGWRLVTQRNNCRVVIFEAGDRVGGRLYSVTPPGMPNTKVELGGRRIRQASEQPRINFLIQMLNEDAPAGQRIDMYELPSENHPENVAYLRGTHLRREDFSKDPGCGEASCVPYRMKFADQGQTPDDLLRKALEQLVPGITNPSLSASQRRTMTRDASFDGQPLYMQGFPQVLTRVLGNEAYQFVVSSGGYEVAPLTQGNAADAVALFPGLLGAKYWGIKQGFQQVPLVLAERFTQHGGEIRHDMELEGFEWKNGCAELHFRGQPTVKAQAVVLALPHQVLKKLALPTSPLRATPLPVGVVGSVNSQAEARASVVSSMQWGGGAQKQSTSVSDLQVGKLVYDSGPSGDTLQGEPEDFGMIQVFPPEKEVVYWKEYASEEVEVAQGGSNAGRASRPGRFVGLREKVGQRLEVDPEWLKNAPPDDLVKDVNRQLIEVQGVTYAPPPQEAVYKVWPDGCGRTPPGVKSWELMEKAIQPFEGIPVHIATTDYSDEQASAEGGLKMVDKIMDRFFAIRPLVADEER